MPALTVLAHPDAGRVGDLVTRKALDPSLREDFDALAEIRSGDVELLSRSHDGKTCFGAEEPAGR